MRKKNVVRLIQIGLHQPEADIIKKIEDEGRDVAPIIRSMINEYGKQEYPKDAGYVEVEKAKLELKKRTAEEQEAWDNLRPEEYAINTLKSRIKDGYATFMTQGATFYLEISKVKDYTTESNLVKNHLAILNGSYNYNGGTYEKPWGKENCEDRVKRWIEETT